MQTIQRRLSNPGLLWYDGPGKSLEEIVSRLCRAFADKFGEPPTHIYVHKGTLPDSATAVKIGDVRIEERGNIPEFHYYATRKEHDRNSRRGHSKAQ